MKKENWEDEFVELYGYLDKYVKGIVGRQGKWIDKLLKSEKEKWDTKLSGYEMIIKGQEIQIEALLLKAPRYKPNPNPNDFND